MNIKMLEIDNFLGIGSAAINFNNISGLTLIDGENSDSPTASSNGAGKSSIFEAIYWCLYGSTKRGLSGDDVVNTTAKKGCEVKLWFDDYLIKRGRKENFLYLYKLDKNGFAEDLTKGTAKETQALIDSIVGMSDLTFSKIAHFGQGDIKDFASLTDAELKQVFEQSLGIGFFADKMLKLRDNKSIVMSAIRDCEADITRIKNEISYLEDNISFIGDSLSKREASIEESKRHLSELELSAKDKQAVALRKASEIKTKEVECEAASQAMKELELEKDKVWKDLELAKDRLRSAEFTLGQLTKNMADGMLELNNIPQNCDKCKRPYDKESLKAAADKIAGKIRDDNSRLVHQKAIVDEAIKEKNALEVKYGALEAKLKELSSTQSTLATLNVERSFLKSLSSELSDIANRIIFIRTQIGSFEALSKEEVAKRDEILGKLKTLKVALKDSNKSLVDATANLEDIKALEEILGNGGLKSYIFDNITPELNRVVGEYMNVLNPSISIEISTMSKLKSGEYRDKFSINIDDGSGVRSYKGFSGGEKQFINLSIALAFNTICRLMTKNSLNVLWLDEPFESLDETASERAVELCKQFSKGIEKPFIISHNPAVRDVISSKIVVARKGGVAKITC